MFKIGAKVYTTDGQAGKLMKVVIDPDTERVTHLIVERGFLQKIDRVAPLETMAEAADEGIRLNVSSAEFEQFPQFTESHFRLPDPGWEHERYQVDDPAHVLRWGIHYAPPQVMEFVVTRDEELKRGVDADLPVVGKGASVYGRDGQVGKVDELQIDEATGMITHLVVKQGLLGRPLVIPMSAVSSVSDTGVNVDLSSEQLKAMSATEPDTG
jgi:sporulation protein YlmC with PRC-barrel domain